MGAQRNELLSTSGRKMGVRLKILSCGSHSTEYDSLFSLLRLLLTMVDTKIKNRSGDMSIFYSEEMKILKP